MKLLDVKIFHCGDLGISGMLKKFKGGIQGSNGKPVPLALSVRK